MPPAARYPLAFALSLVAAGAMQQGLLMTYEHGTVLGTLMPLAGCILATTFVFGVVLSWRPSAAAGSRRSYFLPCWCSALLSTT